MNFITLLLLFVTFQYWFPVVAAIFLLWMIVYPTACTVHLLYVRAFYGKWVKWQLL